MIEMITLDLSLYSNEAILRAIQDYVEIAHIEYQPKWEKNQAGHSMPDHVSCIFHFTQYDLELTKSEFCNYVLELTVSSGGPLC